MNAHVLKSPATPPTHCFLNDAERRHEAIGAKMGRISPFQPLPNPATGACRQLIISKPPKMQQNTKNNRLVTQCKPVAKRFTSSVVENAVFSKESWECSGLELRAKG